MKLLLLQTCCRVRDLFNTKYILFKNACFLLILMLSFITVSAQVHPDTKVESRITVSGLVTDSIGTPLIGVTIQVKDGVGGTFTDKNGKYSIKVDKDAILKVSYIGYDTREIKVNGRSNINIQLLHGSSGLNEVVIVGYGKQKKGSVISAISTVKGETLEKSGGVPNMGMALTGKVPGVVTLSSTGLPGDEEPEIFIRGRSTWHNSSPLILVDGVERPLRSVDVNEVASLTVLKDASATAIYGVRGANGVILITTKTGTKGRAKLSGSIRTTVKSPSKLPSKLDAYGALKLRNRAIVNELDLSPSSWDDYLNPAFLDHYKKPQTEAERVRYPNVDWDDVLFRDYTSSLKASLDARGGGDVIKYFASVNYIKEGDLLKKFKNDRGYQAGFKYQRLNVRSNLDFSITPTTTLSAKIAGSYGVKKRPWGFSGSDYGYWVSAYSTPPDRFLPQYPDGSFGYATSGPADNTVVNLAVSGIEDITNARLNTTFNLTQDLSMLLKGLEASGKIAIDNNFVEGGRGINDLYNSPLLKHIDPWTGAVTYSQRYDPNSRFAYHPQRLWNTEGGTVQDWSTFRKIYYQLQLNYEFNIKGKHNFSEMVLFNRTQNSTGSIVPHRRENWVFRTTYNYNQKYMIEYNGSYNGTEKFGRNYRFGFFSSGGVGWNISKENFMKNLVFVDNLKIRASYGSIGDDNTSSRWLYKKQWEYGNQAPLGTRGEAATPSSYTQYRVTYVGNPNVHWATVTKADLGVDFGFLDGGIDGSIDFFRAKRDNILVSGDNRAVPSYFGQDAPAANLGIMKNKGYEVTINIDHHFGAFHPWLRFSLTHAKNTVIFSDDPALLPEYQKGKDKSVGQAYSFVDNDIYTTWDELYATTKFNTNDNQKLPGGYVLVDYNADGVIDPDDNVPYGFPGTPQNIYNTAVGVDWKGFSLYAQFYGVNNVSRLVVLTSLNGYDMAFDFPDGYWSKNNPNAKTLMPRWKSERSWTMEGTRYMYDGSYLRLKNVQLSYTFGSKSNFSKNLGIRSVKIYVGGNNLFLWSKLPDDREANYAGTGWASQGAYPTIKRYNLGLEVNF